MVSDEMVSDDTAQATATSSDAPVGRSRRRVPVQAALVALAALLVVGAGVAVWPNRADAFCERVAELPSVASVGEDGTPSSALLVNAEAYGRLAEAAGDEAVAAAARTFAAHQRSLADAVAGASSSSEVVEQVQSLDQDDLARATATLDDEIARRCS
jgi:hypothetical protein